MVGVGLQASSYMASLTTQRAAQGGDMAGRKMEGGRRGRRSQLHPTPDF